MAHFPQYLPFILIIVGVIAEAEYSPEDGMRNFARKVAEKCLDLADFNSPEYAAFSLEKDSLLELGRALVFDGTQPHFQVCSPGNSWPGPWLEYRDRVNAQYPDGGDKKKEKSKSEQLKYMQRRIKVVSVTHPLNRLAKVFLSSFKGGSLRTGGDDDLNQVENFKVIEKVFGVEEGKLTFKHFVRFMTRAGYDFPEHASLLRDEAFNRPWNHYYKDCPVCQTGGFPDFVLKAESDHLEEDLDYLLDEMLGVEDVEFPTEKIAENLLSDDELKDLYSELNRREFDDLVDLLRIDLDMYGYSSDSYLKFIEP